MITRKVAVKTRATALRSSAAAASADTVVGDVTFHSSSDVMLYVTLSVVLKLKVVISSKSVYNEHKNLSLLKLNVTFCVFIEIVLKRVLFKDE